MKNKFKLYLIIFVIIIVASTLISHLSGFDFSFAQNKKVKLGSNKKELKADANLQNINSLFTTVAKEATQSVVSIIVTTKVKNSPTKELEEYFHQFPEFKIPHPKEEDMKSQGSGSGVIVSEDGYIITNNHVVENAIENGIEVVTNDSKRFKAKLIGTDPLTDVAVIKIEEKNLSVAALGNSENLQVGEWVLAIGSPLGLSSTVTAGIVSYIGRRIDIINDSYGVENFIQTDAAINPGNSGGALVNIYGEVIGINTAIATTNARYQGYGFAIPINLAKNVAENLIENGKVERGYIGVQIQSIDETIAKASGLDKPEGVLVQDVLENGAAKNAGIISGDIILSVDGKSVKSANELQAYVASKRPGDIVEIKIWRDKNKITKNVKLKAREEKGTEIALNQKNENLDNAEEISSKPIKFDKLGFTISKLDLRLKNERKSESDVLVSEVTRFEEAESRGLRVRDIIVEADKNSIRTINDFKKIIESKKSGDALMLRVKDERNTTRYVALEIP